ncbi:DNA (cytosine-5-)-methyltransferase [Maribacter polysiphoniae]|uniref:Cytosine-specific methyltransferase n=1 Tax=Maribacter polysiphoniae TaxID=429344 RepID=A0A316DPV4_9FLAO|nr:DNA (cytosine-5-)-methyltransferase [Maribacter polysiphoniae]MBD1262799.1 DNA (cytosine-5-)-methyltransferase [Maribacter polysiphoniae]PWK20111.1 DNA (cytosine-5)-methyltransferase 1 [Maribacter polysiphoniae]
MPIKVVELFAGVGGFRIGLEGYPKREDSKFDVVWSNQWEPSTKTQHANMVYNKRWPNANHCGENIEDVIENNFDIIPDHDLLVGGFPCQDYSVATTLKNSKGLIGKKGVLWWSIEAILRRKENKPKYLLLENVDRLLKSPSNQRGRDFAVMLASLNNLGYAVEWRVINAAEYGMPQRRRRIYFTAYHKSTDIYRRLKQTNSKADWLESNGVFAKSFPISEMTEKIITGEIEKDLIKVSNKFNLNEKLSPFQNCGLMIDGSYHTVKVYPSYNGPFKTLGDVLVDIEDVPNEFFISKEDVEKEKGWKYLKGSKNEPRYNKALDYYYNYTEGSMIFPDALNNASRTIITGEGGKSPSRFKHVVEQKGRLRRLTPLELERLNTFPDNHTKHPEITDTKRAFFMGNALVVEVIDRIGKQLYSEINLPLEELV